MKLATIHPWLNVKAEPGKPRLKFLGEEAEPPSLDVSDWLELTKRLRMFVVPCIC